MKKILIITTTLFVSVYSQSQKADFEIQLPQADTAWFGQDQITDGDTTFINGSYIFENNYNAIWESFIGWSYSNVKDNITLGYDNQFSNITGSGESSSQYAICYTNGNSRLFNQSAINFSGAYFTNSTYAYFSMLEGDDFSKQFGSNEDASGTQDGTNGEDWLLLTIYGLNADTSYTGDSINFYLADYRFTDNNEDYIVDKWEWVDLSSLGTVYGLDFKLSSTDNGNWGMNTPAYFAMDNLIGGYLNLASESINLKTQIFPNPSNGLFNIEASVGSKVKIINSNGQVIKQYITKTKISSIDISNMPSGFYILNVQNNNSIESLKLIKQ